MREIKFRLIKDGKIVGYEQHVVVEGEIEIQHKLPGNKRSWHDIRFEPARFIHHDAKELFTGPRDHPGGISMGKLAREAHICIGSAESKISEMTYSYPIAEDDRGRLFLVDLDTGTRM